MQTAKTRGALQVKKGVPGLLLNILLYSKRANALIKKWLTNLAINGIIISLSFLYIIAEKSLKRKTTPLSPPKSSVVFYKLTYQLKKILLKTRKKPDTAFPPLSNFNTIKKSLLKL